MKGEVEELRTSSTKVVAKEQYMNLLFRGFLECITVQSVTENSQIYKKVEMLTKVMINLIPKPETRAELKEKRKLLIKDLKKQSDSMTSEELNDEIYDINTDVIGEIMEICDEFIGVVKKQKVMPMLNIDKTKELEAKYYPDMATNNDKSKEVNDGTASEE